MTEEKKPKPKKKRKTGINTKAKKKTAAARAVIRKGTGKVRLNHKLLETVSPKRIRTFIEEPMVIAGEELMKSVDIEVKIHGGGFMGQAVAARGAIAKALLDFSKDKKLKEKFLAYDRLLIVDDARRKESKKPLGKGARSKKQSSKR